MEMDNVIPKFYEALEKMNIDYDEETGKLSKSIIFIIYDTYRKVSVDRVLIFKDYFLIIEDAKRDTRKINFKNIRGYKAPDNIIKFDSLLNNQGKKDISVNNSDPSKSEKQKYKSVRIYPGTFEELRERSFKERKAIVQTIDELLEFKKNNE